MLHGEVPLSLGDAAEGLAVAGPELPRGDLLLGRPDEVDRYHPGVELDPAEQIEVARVGFEVVHDLVVAGEDLGGVRRPGEVGEGEVQGGRLKLGGGGGVGPEAADAGRGLEDDGAEPTLRHVLAGGEAADARADDAHPLLLHGSLSRSEAAAAAEGEVRRSAASVAGSSRNRLFSKIKSRRLDPARPARRLF